MSTAYDMVDGVLWSPDGSLLATVSHDFVTATYRIEVWDPVTGSRTARTEDIERGTGMPAWSPDGRRLATAERRAPGRPGRLDRASAAGHPRRRGASAGAACWSPDGRRLAFLDGGVGRTDLRRRRRHTLVRSAATYGRAAVLCGPPTDACSRPRGTGGSPSGGRRRERARPCPGWRAGCRWTRTGPATAARSS
ncbi:hypothetical protein O1M54_11100 [Streptomyces diastatochromogenes]|nr:hypothetical protein [Streptomyces diastatochromogenes]